MNIKTKTRTKRTGAMDSWWCSSPSSALVLIALAVLGPRSVYLTLLIRSVCRKRANQAVILSLPKVFQQVNAIKKGGVRKGWHCKREREKSAAFCFDSSALCNVQLYLLQPSEFGHFSFSIWFTRFSASCRWRRRSGVAPFMSKLASAPNAMNVSN